MNFLRWAANSSPFEVRRCEAVSYTHLQAAIGKIAGEQLIKLMTLGLTEEEAVQKIIEGFLK